MFAFDTFQDQLCLWCCIAVHRGARPDRCTREVRALGNTFWEKQPTARDAPPVPLQIFHKVENFLNNGKPLAEWLGIRVYEPIREANGEIIWSLVQVALAKV